MVSQLNIDIMKLKIKVKLIRLFNVFSDSGDKENCCNMFVGLINTSFDKSISQSIVSGSSVSDLISLIDIDNWTFQDYSEFNDILSDLIV